IKWSGAFLEGAGLTLGEEVEQVNAFVSRIAVTTKHMSKAGRNDMLTLMAMRWNEQKMKNLATYLSRRYLKTTKALDMKDNGSGVDEGRVGSDRWAIRGLGQGCEGLGR
ncbi:unnamed protein product, partial [Gadus morhua 'NCC']